MEKIDISSWKEFKIGDLFETEKNGNKLQVPTGASISVKNLKEGNTPRITVTNVNNGISKYCTSEDENYRTYNNFISVSFLGTVFYHPYEASLDMKVHCLKLKNKELTRGTGMFLVTIIKNSILQYSYSNQISSTVLPKLSLKLPVTKTGDIDFEYMEKYIRKKERECPLYQNLENNSMKRCDISTWKNFHLYDLFKIDAGTKMDKIAMSFLNPKINFIGRTGINNGVTTCVDEVKGYTPYKAGNLTLALGGAYLGSCFVQKKDFYTSQNVIVLIPKEKMSLYAKLFISAVIFKKGNTHYKAFIDELNRHIKTDFTIKLPVDSNGNLNFKYMEDYIKKTKNTVLNKFEKFNYLVS